MSQADDFAKWQWQKAEPQTPAQWFNLVMEYLHQHPAAAPVPAKGGCKRCGGPTFGPLCAKCKGERL